MWTEAAAVTDCAVAKSVPCIVTVDRHDRSVWRFCPNSQCSDEETEAWLGMSQGLPVDVGFEFGPLCQYDYCPYTVWKFRSLQPEAGLELTTVAKDNLQRNLLFLWSLPSEC